MIVRVNDLNLEEINAPKGGHGSAIKYAYEQAGNYDMSIKMFAVMELQPDSKIGEHVHEDDMELYLILNGKPIANDNGEETILNPGDLLITEKGQKHSLENKTNSPITFLAIILK
jgi:mannose-6-phosphate isomerase-like protein (cupin superfamily)